MTLTRQALLPDVEHLYAIIQPYAERGILLARSLSELSENVRDFIVAEEDSKQGARVLGCGALHLYGMHLAEMRSIAVVPEKRGSGVGRALVEALVAESLRHKVGCLCLFTRTPGFFGHLGFQVARHQDLPDKIYKDCLHCPKRMNCDEVAMVMGRIPPHTSELRDPQISIPLLRPRF